MFLCACSGGVTPGGGAFPRTIPSDADIQGRVLTEIRLTADETSFPVGCVTQLRAWGVFDDGHEADITHRVNWISLNPGRGSVSSTGLVTAMHAGPLSIQARLGPGRGTVALEVSRARLQSIEVAPAPDRLPVGIESQYRLFGTYHDATVRDLTAVAIWSTDDAGVATVASNGVVTGVAPGRSRIRARFGGIEAESTVNVEVLELVRLSLGSLHGPRLPVGTKTRLRSRALFQDGVWRDVTRQVQWASNHPEWASVTPDGLVTAHAVSGSPVRLVGVLGSSRLELEWSVVQAELRFLQVSSTATGPAGLTQRLKATGRYVWSPPAGGEEEFEFELTPVVAWQSLDPSVATVAADGLTTAVGAGVTLIRASLGAVSGESEITVSSAVLTSLTLSPSPTDLLEETSRRCRAIGTFSDGTERDLTEVVTWASNQTNLVFLSNAPGNRGLVRGLDPGVAYVSARWKGFTSSRPVRVNVVALQNLEVRPTVALSAPGATRRYRAFGRYVNGQSADLSDRVAWESQDPSLVSVSSDGRAQVLGAVGGLSGVRAVHPSLGSRQATLHFGSYAFLAKPTLNAVQPYRLDPVDGTLTNNGDLFASGTAPYHLTLEESGLRLLILSGGQLRCSLVDPATGQLTSGGAVAAPSGAKQVVVQPYGDLVYVTSPTGLTSYRLGPGGSLSAVGATPVSGVLSLVADPRGRFLYLGTSSGELRGYAIGPAGELTEVYTIADSGSFALTVSSLGLIWQAWRFDGGSSVRNLAILEDGSLEGLLSQYSRFVDDWPGQPPPPPDVVEQVLARCDRSGRLVYEAIKRTDGSSGQVFSTVSVTRVDFQSGGGSRSLPAPSVAAMDAPLANYLYLACEGRSDLHIIPMSPTGSLGTPVLLETGSPTSGIAVTP